MSIFSESLQTGSPDHLLLGSSVTAGFSLALLHFSGMFKNVMFPDRYTSTSVQQWSVTGMESIAGSRPTNDSSSEKLDALAWYLLPTVITVPPLGIPANWLVIHLLLGKNGVCSTPEIFTLQLACFDMLFCFLLIIEFISFVYTKRMEESFFFAWGINQTGGPMLLCLLSVDSYIGVCHPLVFHNFKDARIRLSLCLLVFSITSASCYLVKAYKPNKRNAIMGLLFIAILVISSCTFNVLRFLCKSGPSRKEVHPVKRRASNIVLTSYVLLNFHYIPPLIEHLIRQFGPKYLQQVSVLSAVSYGFLASASFTQPLSYLLRTRQLPEIRCLCISAITAKATGLEKSEDPHW